MKQLSLTVDFKIMNNSAFLNKSNFIMSSMTNNKSFPKPSPSLKDLDAAIKKFAAAMTKANDGSKADRQARDQQRAVVTQMLMKLKTYAEFEANGDLLILTSSGFTVAGQKGKSGQSAEIKKFVVKQGKLSGVINGSFTKVDWATSYGYDYTPTPIVDANWKTISGSNCRFQLPGLLRGTEYAVRICAKGPNNKIIYSNTLTILVV